MNQAQMLREFAALSPEAQTLVAELVAYLSKEQRRAKSSRKKKTGSLLNERFIGIWKERDDMQDSHRYVRNLRKSEWR